MDAYEKKKRGRPLRTAHDPLTPMEQKAMDEIRLNGVSVTEAMRRAGYSDPNGEVSGFLNRPPIQRALVEIARQGAVTLEFLIETSIKTLYEAQGASDAKWGERIAAARAILDVARQIGINPLATQPRDPKSDAKTVKELAAEVIGKATRTAEPPEPKPESDEPEPKRIAASLPTIMMIPPEGKPN